MAITKTTTNTSGLVARWLVEEGSGTTLTDSVSSPANDLTIFGSSGDWEGDSSGKCYNLANLNTAGFSPTYASGAPGLLQTAGPLSLEAVIYEAGQGAGTLLVIYDRAGVGGIAYLSKTSTAGGYTFGVRDSVQYGAATGITPDGTGLTHVIGSYDTSGNRTLFINGIQVAQASGGATRVAASGTPTTYIGTYGYASSANYIGKIYLAAAYNRAISASEAAARYAEITHIYRQTLAMTAAATVTLAKRRFAARLVTVLVTTQILFRRGVFQSLPFTGTASASFMTGRAVTLVIAAGNSIVLRAGRGYAKALAFSRSASVTVANSKALFVRVLASGTTGLLKRVGKRLAVQGRPQALLFAPGLAAFAADPFLAIRLFLLSLAFLKPKMITNAHFLSILDAVGASYRSADLQATATALTQVGAQIYGDGSTIYGTGNETFILRLASAADGMLAAAQPDVVNRAIYGTFFQSIASYLAQTAPTGQSTLDTYAAAANAAVPFSFLVSPNTAYLQFLLNNKQATLLMRPGNVYAPATTFGTVSGGAACIFAAGGNIRTANDTSGPSALQGFTPALGVAAEVTTSVAGTLTVTLTASGWDSTGAAVTGRTWTAVLDNAAAGSHIEFVPGTAGDRISQVTGVTGSGVASAGTFALKSKTERSAG